MSPLAIDAVGLVCSLGLDSADACAAARAGLARVSPIVTLNTAIDPTLAKETLDGIPPLVGHRVPTIATGHAGLGRLLALARPALADLLRKAGPTREELARTGLCLVLSDGFYQSRWAAEPEPLGEEAPPGYAQVWSGIAAAVGPRLCAALGLPIDPAVQRVLGSGRLGLLTALDQAARWLAAGQIERCLIGTVESCVEPCALLASGAAGVLRTDANPVGFLPGEAAAFVLVGPASARRSASAPVLVLAMSEAVDAAYLDPEAQPLGRGIGAVVERLAQAGPDGRPGLPPLLIADLNGTEHRAADWGHALVRLRDRLGESEPELWLPAAAFGETGAATGGVALCMVFEAARRGRVPGAAALLVLCADGGGRGGVLLATRSAAR